MSGQLRPWLEYGVLSLIVLAPMLLPGFILTMDMVFTPHLPFPQESTNTSLLQFILWLVNLVLPGDVVEKIVLFAILLLSGVGMHLLVQSLKIRHFESEYVQWGTYFAGIFYMFNPFVYSRFMTGQWMVLLGYALLPFFVRALFRLLEAPSLKASLWLAVWMFLIVSVSLHHVGIMGLIGLIALIVAFIDTRRQRRTIARFGTLSVAVTIGLNLYWLLPMLGGLNATVRQFDATHFAAFATGPLAEVIRLQGFWAEPLRLFVLPKEQLAGWGLLMIGLWVLVVLGMRTGWRHLRWQTVVLGVSMGGAFILATTPLLQWASSFLPFVGGYREPHKFINLVALGYALCGGIGVMVLLSWLARKYNDTLAGGITIVLLLLPIALTPTMLWGFSGQLMPRSYPSDWATMNEYLRHQTNGAVLFLPWHQYMNFRFAGRIIANPAEKFFSVPVIAGDNPEFRNISPTIPNDTKKYINDILQSQNPDFAKLGIRYVLVAKEYDYKKYNSILERSDITKRLETESLIVYEIERTP